MRSFIKDIESRILIYDGSKGYLLQKMGLRGGECAELWNAEKPDMVREVYSQYKDAGSDVIQTNTFTGNRITLDKHSLGDRTYELNYLGTKLAREIAGEDMFVAASIGPLGMLFEPSGELTFEIAYEAFKEQIRAVEDGGADLINFETFTDLAEMRAALLAAKENTSLPVICSMAYEAGGRTLMGNDPQTVAAVLLALGADMIGTNCSFGAGHMLEIVRKLHEAQGGFLSVKPNAGLPEMIDGKACYRESAESFASQISEYVKYGARLIGGCCGTTPEYIKAVKEKLEKLEAVPAAKRSGGLIASGARCLAVAEIKAESTGVLAITVNEDKYKTLAQVEDQVLDLSTEAYNAVLISMEAFEDKALYDVFSDAVNLAQGYIKAPLILKCSSSEEMEKALRIYKGIAGIVIDKNTDREKTIKAAEKYGSEIVRVV